MTRKRTWPARLVSNLLISPNPRAKPLPTTLAARARTHIMTIGKPSYTYEELLACGRGELFGAGNAQRRVIPKACSKKLVDFFEWWTEIAM